ncbi:MAG: NUDIX domain-containing protein [Patescibacteria group bacterium]
MALTTILKIATWFRKLYWRIARPTTYGVKAIATHNGKILLIKNRYDEYLYLPGGAIKKNENPTDAIRRELEEECGIKSKNHILLGTYINLIEGKKDNIFLIGCDIENVGSMKRGIEIEDHSFIDLENPPDGTSSATLRRINEYRSGTYAGGKW